jgi:Arc/MetJ family transcription regulator
MRTNIDIDDRLMRKAMKSCGARTKKATVERALKLLADTNAQAAFRRFRGRIQWEGDLEQSRTSRVSG